MIAEASELSRPGRLNSDERASADDDVDAKATTAMMTHATSTHSLWCSTQRVNDLMDPSDRTRTALASRHVS